MVDISNKTIANEKQVMAEWESYARVIFAYSPVVVALLITQWAFGFTAQMQPVLSAQARAGGRESGGSGDETKSSEKHYLLAPLQQVFAPIKSLLGFSFETVG